MNWLAKDFKGAPFQLFGVHHLTVLTVLMMIIISLYYLGKSYNEKLKKCVRYFLIFLLPLQEISYHLWNYSVGLYSIQKMLPLHLCSMLVWLTPIMLLTKNYRLYELAFFWGIGGASMAMLTPDIASYGFPHYRFFQVFVSHGSIILAACYATFVDHMRPTWKSMLRVIVLLNIFAVVVYAINILIGANYMFVVHKPETASIYDLFGPWPWYLLVSEALCVVIFLLLYIPFTIKDRKVKLMQTQPE